MVVAAVALHTLLNGVGRPYRKSLGDREREGEREGEIGGEREGEREGERGGDRGRERGGERGFIRLVEE